MRLTALAGDGDLFGGQVAVCLECGDLGFNRVISLHPFCSDDFTERSGRSKGPNHNKVEVKVRSQGLGA